MKTRCVICGADIDNPEWNDMLCWSCSNKISRTPDEADYLEFNPSKFAECKKLFNHGIKLELDVTDENEQYLDRIVNFSSFYGIQFDKIIKKEK